MADNEGWELEKRIKEMEQQDIRPDRFMASEDKISIEISGEEE